jgi:molybdopterin converting factor small subunit
MQFTAAQAIVELERPRAMLEDLLRDLFTVHPGIRDRILTEQGTIREHVNIFVGQVNVRSGSGLKTPVADDVEVWIIPAISGGQVPFQPAVAAPQTRHHGGSSKS